ncbi:MAG: HD domain-containing phosphohydrolase [Gemmataceae bacterium]
MKRLIRLRGVNGALKGRTWESSELLRVGRLDQLEIVLDDNSVSRYHAEVRATDRGWRIRDLGSTNGTRLNGVRLTTGQWPIKAKDLLQFGEVSVVVECIQEVNDQDSGVSDSMRVEASTRATWDQAVQGLALDSRNVPRPGEQLVALLRAGHHLVHLESEEDLLNSILEDAVSVLDAQRGAIVLAVPPDNRLQLKAITTGQVDPQRSGMFGRVPANTGRFQFSQSLAMRCFNLGESILCQRIEEDPELAMARSIAEGSMASVLCVLLRTPRRQLGVLHLDRSPWQKPFTMEDLRLADALAANVSMGIECATLLRKQRELFLETITILAQAVEMRDQYTGGHTYRVTTYSVMLAEHMKMSSSDIDLIRIGTPLHDIGKIGIDDAILRKPDKLTNEEFEVMKTHTIKGAEILETIGDLKHIIPIVRNHHERWDGRGYPDGLAGEAINPLARVVALADAFDAMTSDRPYRKGLPPEVAFAEIEKMAGKQFDPVLAAGFLAIRDRIIGAMSGKIEVPSSERRARPLATAY